MKDRKPIRRAERALCARIEALAPTAEAEDIGRLAEAFAKVKWGAQGRTDQTYDYMARREQPLQKGAGFR